MVFMTIHIQQKDLYPLFKRLFGRETHEQSQPESKINYCASKSRKVNDNITVNLSSNNNPNFSG